MVRSVTQVDVAREAGVSRALVSIAFRGARGVNEETRDHIFAVAKRLGYRPNGIAARLASKTDDALGVFLQDLHNDVFADIYDGIRDVIGTDRHLVTAVGRADGSLDGHALDSLASSRVAVVIAVGLTLPDPEIQRFAETIPLISVSRCVPGVRSVYSDDVAGARAATEHLAGLGHRRIVFLANPDSDGYHGRANGYSQAMSAAGLRPHIVRSTYSRFAAATDAGRLLDQQQPTAIFAHNDQAALGVLDAMAIRDLHAPADVSVVGYDDSSVSRTPGNALTTVNLHGREMGSAAARNAVAGLNRAYAPELDLMLTPELVVRGTTGPPP